MEGTKQNKMGVMPMGKLLMQMSVPLMMSLLIQSLYNIVDSMFVAGYSEEALTATTLVYPVQFLMIAVGVGTAVGMNALLSRRIGQKWTEEACQAAGTGLIIVLAESLVFCLLGVFAKQQIAAMLTDDPDLMRACLSYLSINLVWCWGLFLQTLCAASAAGGRRYGSFDDLIDYWSSGKHCAGSDYDFRLFRLPGNGGLQVPRRLCCSTASATR